MKKIDENLPSVLEDEEAKELTELSADEEVASTGSKEIAVEPETTEVSTETAPAEPEPEPVKEKIPEDP